MSWLQNLHMLGAGGSRPQHLWNLHWEIAMHEKNVGGQKWAVYAYDNILDAPKAGDASNITAKISIDGATASALGDVNPVELESGYYVFDLTQAETNGDMLVIIPVSATSNIIVIGSPASSFTTEDPVTNVTTGLTTQGYTAARAPNLDNMDKKITTAQSELTTTMTQPATIP